MDLNNLPVACVSYLSDWEGSPPRSLLPQTVTSKLLKVDGVLGKMFCSLDPAIVHSAMAHKVPYRNHKDSSIYDNKRTQKNASSMVSLY